MCAREQIDKIVAGGKWVMPAHARPPPLNVTSQAGPNGVFATRDLTYTLYGDPGGLKSEEPAAAAALRDLLFPATVRVVPFGVVLGILVSFLVVVAPSRLRGSSVGSAADATPGLRFHACRSCSRR